VSREQPRSATVRNVATIARREYTWRGRSRSFAISTLILVVLAVGVALAPVIIEAIGRNQTAERIAVYQGSADPSVDVATALESLLDATAGRSGSGSQPSTSAGFAVTAVTDLAAARAEVERGQVKAAIALSRTTSGDLAFHVYSKLAAFERTSQLIQAAVTTLTIQDRLARAGIAPGDQARLFSPASVDFEQPPSAGAGASTLDQLIGGSILGVALTIAIFIAIMVYGQWVAMSVVEEKSSRVMEIILGAARPVELMTGKVLGVGGLALTQYAIVFVPVALVVLFEGAIAALVLGGNATVELPKGLSVSLLVGFGIFFVLGFLLYATLYAGVASLVSRQEDVNQIIGPLTLISTLGYLVAVWISSGLIELESPLVRILSYVPFLSPYIMVSRMATGQVEPWEIGIAVFILVISIGIALWASARVYAAGVLLYGQKPGVRVFIQAFRNG
jgi:ABC-2 type transport system permease protein